MAPIIRSAHRGVDVAPIVVAQSPALEYLLAEGFSVRRVRCAPLRDINDPRKPDLFQETDDILSDEAPDAILTGLSGPGVGIDEALTYRGHTPFKYSVQDSEGLVVLGFDQAAPTYFVANEWAAARTRRYPKVAPVVVGSLRHAAYAALSPRQLRAVGRARLHGSATATTVGFYGQPAWQWGGYARTIARLAASVHRVMPEALVFYRPHPKESPVERDATLDLFSASHVHAVLDPNPDIETSLCVPDIVASCYSLCNVDQIYLQRQSNVPLGTVLYLLFEPDLLKTFAGDGGAEVPWHVQQEVAFSVTRAEDLDHALLRCATPDVLLRAWTNIQRRVAPVEDASNGVIKRILEDVRAVEGRLP